MNFTKASRLPSRAVMHKGTQKNKMKILKIKSYSLTVACYGTQMLN